MLQRLEFKILLRIILLFLVMATAAFLVMKGHYFYLIFVVPVLVYQFIDILHFQSKVRKELIQFVESVHYRDFSRHFDVKHAPYELQPLREGFNQINTTLKTIARERETSSQYLQKILEMVDTGILSYDLENGEVIWMNDSLKRMLMVPYLKTIHSLEKRNAPLYQDIITLKSAEEKVATLHLENRTYKILLSATAFQTDGRKFRLIAFQNINEALDETESKAWQKLLSVMTHEIMNSVAPISSLADTLRNRLEKSMIHIKDEDTVHDLELGIETIKRRSESLLKFAETYRNLNKVTKPNLQRIYVRDIFENIYQLMEPTLVQKNIEMDTVLQHTDLALEADVSLIEQVLINLVVNAKEALKDLPDGRIILSASIDNKNRIAIKVSDNGPGISEDILENIFIPFFSTKKTGSGIGLSLCKQIMMLHKGNIQVHSIPGEGTAFTLQF